jgi:hypothetical protein
MQSRRRIAFLKAQDHANYAITAEICLEIAMCALPPKADMEGHSPNVRFVPKGDITRLQADSPQLCWIPRQCLRMKGIKPQFPNGVVNSVSFVSTTNTARSLAGCVSLALALTLWRSPGSSEKLSPVLKVVTGPSLT